MILLFLKRREKESVLKILDLLIFTYTVRKNSFYSNLIEKFLTLFFKT